MTKFYGIFAIGPVQSFIASARKMEDLWGGSYILSYLMEEAILKFYEIFDEELFELIYPHANKDDIIDKRKQADAAIMVANLPNKITFQIEANDKVNIKENLKKVEETILCRLQELSNQAIEEVFKGNREIIESLKPKAVSQMKEFLEIYWLLQPLSHSEKGDYGKLNQQLQALKLQKPLVINKQKGLPCTIYSQMEALCHLEIGESDSYGKLRHKLEATWSKRNEIYKPKDRSSLDKLENAKIRDKEFLCAISLVKRVARDIFIKKYGVNETYFKKFKSVMNMGSDQEKYYAILLMDGDNMGNLFQGAEKPRVLSKKLSNFSGKIVPQIIANNNGVLIYAGGDDVMAFLPTDRALIAADELRKAYGSDKEGLGNGATCCIGIAFGHQKSNMHDLLNQARKLESAAKSYRDEKHEKNAIAIGVLPRSGEHLGPVVMPWELNGQAVVNYIQGPINYLMKTVSPNFVYQFASTFQLFSNIKEHNLKTSQLIEQEYYRLLKRSFSEADIKEEVEVAMKAVFHLYPILGLNKFIDLLKILTFFRRREKEKCKR